MAVNRFMSPVQTRYFQTYVDQFVPLPFELMQRKAQQEQSKFNAVKAEGQNLMANLNEDFLRVDQNPLLSSKIEEVHETVRQGVDGYQGDWRQMDALVANLKTDYSKWITTGAGALAKNNKKLHDTNAKEIDESNMAGIDKTIGKRLIYDRYAVQQGAANNTEFQPYAPYDPADFQKKALDAIKAIDPNQQSISFADYDDKGNLIIDFYKDTKDVTKERINKAVRQHIYNDRQFDDMVKWRYGAYSFYDENVANMSLEEFKDRTFKEMFGGYGDPYAYDQETQRTHAKETAEAGERAKKKYEDKDPVFKYSANFHLGNNPIAEAMINPDTDQLDVHMKGYKALTSDFLGVRGGSKSPIYQFFEDSYPGLKLDEYKGMMNELSSDHGLNLESPYDQRRFIEGLANGSFDDDLVGMATTGDLSPANVKSNLGHMKELANSQLERLKDQDYLNLELVRDLANAGRISNEKYNDYKSYVNEIDRTVEKLERIRQQKPEEADKIDDQIEALMSYKSNPVEAFSTGVNKPTYDTKYINSLVGTNLTDNISDIFDPRIFEENRDFLNKDLKKRYTKSQSLTLTGSTGIVTRDTQTGELVEDTGYISDVQKYLKSNPALLMNVKVLGPGEEGDKFLSEIVHEQAVSIAGESEGADYEKARKRVMDEMYQGVMLSNSYNPNTGAPMLHLGGGRYVMDLSDAPNHANADIMSMVTNEQKQRMKVNTMVNKAIISPSGIHEVADGLTIRAVQPEEINQEMILSPNQDGSYMVVEIDPDIIGRDSRAASHYIIDANTGQQLVLEIEKLKDISKVRGGFISLPVEDDNGNVVIKKVPVDEVIREKIKEYSEIGTIKGI